MSVKQWLVCLVVFAFGIVCARGMATAFGDTVKIIQKPAIFVRGVPVTIQDEEVPLATTTCPNGYCTPEAFVKQYRPTRNRWIVPQANIEVFKAKTPTYKVLETPREPFVRRGFFRDRIIQPRRTNLRIVK